MFRSIRWTLLFWYGLILLLVIAGFGATLYLHLGTSMRKVRDTRLREWAQAVARGYNERHGERHRVILPDPYARALESPADDAPYYVVWNIFGKVVASSRPGLNVTFPEEFRLPEPPRRPPAPPRPTPLEEVGPPSKEEMSLAKEHPDHANRRMRPFLRRPPREFIPPVGDLLKTPVSRTSGPWREVIVRGSVGSTVLVGQNDEEDRRHLREFLMTMLAASAAAFSLAILGGWFLAEWTLAPISRISEAASSISATNLSKRIDVTRTESELGRLAQILNHTFTRLEASFVRQKQFTADASHELRTPLAVVMSHCELALRKERTAAEYRGFFETSLKAARRMRSIVEGLLTLARADASVQNLVREPVQLGEIVEESVAMLEPLAGPEEVSIKVEAEPLAILGDRERLRELVLNLVTNAIRYNRFGGSVTIRLAREGNIGRLSVIDTGIGIAPRDQLNIFERFYRADPVRSREIGGSGLGLAITKWIAESHGGTIAFTSQEGSGTTFEVCLPLLLEVPADPQNDERHAPSAEDVPSDQPQAPVEPTPEFQPALIWNPDA
ncbi:sensor histidine kinase [Singulisphaera sp. PoT]|uniref:sensor histidine kinase n=1 Tax=Singulisphaera sp. PoT TaxID=3411797 RepID=UPI003BF5DC7B